MAVREHHKEPNTPLGDPAPSRGQAIQHSHKWGSSLPWYFIMDQNTWPFYAMFPFLGWGGNRDALYLYIDIRGKIFHCILLMSVFLSLHAFWPMTF